VFASLTIWLHFLAAHLFARGAGDHKGQGSGSLVLERSKVVAERVVGGHRKGNSHPLFLKFWVVGKLSKNVRLSNAKKHF